jgi:endonuclease YncB( thermonuclease family)
MSFLSNVFSCFSSNDVIPIENPVKEVYVDFPVIKKIDELEELSEKFNKINPTDIPYFSFKSQTFIAKHCNIYDGDTFSVVFFYKGDLIKYHCRCIGYDCAEMKPSLSNPNRDNEKELAHKAKNRLIELLNKHPTKLIKIECDGFDKYGRLLIKFWNFVDEESINDIMIKEGHGKPYDGGKKDKW